MGKDAMSMPTLDGSVEPGAPLCECLQCYQVSPECWLSYSPPCCLVLVAFLSDVNDSYLDSVRPCLLLPEG